MRRAFALTSLAYVAAGVMSRPARACSPIECSKTRALPSDGRMVPANAPALVLAWSGGGDERESQPESVVLEELGGDGVPVQVAADPAAKGFFLVTPETPLVEGRDYRLRFAERCESNGRWTPVSEGPGEPREQHYVAGPPAELPSKCLGTLEVTREASRELLVADWSGRCMSSIDAAVADVRWVPSPEVAPYLELVSVTAFVDGVRWAESRYGATTQDGVVRWGAPEIFGRELAPFFRECHADGDDRSHDQGLSAGRHDVELRFHVAGASEDPPPVKFTIALACAGDPAGTESLPKAPLVIDTCSETPDPVDPVPHGKAEFDDPRVECGCGGDAGGAFVLWFAALALASRRRARVRDASRP